MAYSNALSAYKETRIRTASQGQLILMLYDEAIKQLDQATEVLTQESTKKPNPAFIERINKSLVKAQEIITELMASLDFDNGGELANNLFALYNWFNRELLSSNISRDTKRIKSVRNMMDDLRQAWQEIVARTSAESSGRAQQGVHIAG